MALVLAVGFVSGYRVPIRPCTILCGPQPVTITATPIHVGPVPVSIVAN
jgi:hypothetical protein